MKKWLFIIVIFWLIWSSFVLAQDKIEVYFFYSMSCPFCAKEKKFLEKLEKEYIQIEVKKYEITSNEENAQLYHKFLEDFQVPEEKRGLVPITFIGANWVVGYGSDATTGKEIEGYIKSLLGEKNNNESCPPKEPSRIITIFGKEIIISSEMPLVLMALIFGLANGINPCMLSVLIMLISYLLSISSPKRAIRAGIIFGASVFLIYFSLMVGIFKSLCGFQEKFVDWVVPIKTGLGALFLVMGILMIKDFFLPRGKLSFSIPTRAKPILESLVKRSTTLAVILLALFSSLAELPCTFVMPLGFVTILSNQGVSPYFYLLLYNLCFVTPLFIIVGISGIGLSRAEKIEKWRERSKKTMRLVSGILLGILGIMFLFKIL